MPETSYAATKYAAGFLPPTFLVALRFDGGGLLLLVLRFLEPGAASHARNFYR